MTTGQGREKEKKDGKTAAASTLASERKPRQENKYQPGTCPGTVGELCKAIDAWAKAVENWGDGVLSELDDLWEAVDALYKHLGLTKGPGPGPQDATKPPKPPFGGP
jgi:hypothetical protein